jgi:hypothetical protein
VANLASDSNEKVESGMLEVGELPELLNEVISPLTVSVAQNDTFDVSFKLTCSGSSCGEVGVTLDPTSQLTPIARWDVVPNQIIESGQIFKAGIIAFHRLGVESVKVDVFNSAGNPVDLSGCRNSVINNYQFANPGKQIDVTSNSITVYDSTYNSRTGVWEYWVPIIPSCFGFDGQIYLDPTVRGNDGGVRNKFNGGGKLGLGRLSLWVNQGGTLPKFEAWVNPTGDGNGQVGNPSRTFKNISSAAQAIKSAAGGGVVSRHSFIYLDPGTYNVGWRGSGIELTKGLWLTVKPREE